MAGFFNKFKGAGASGNRPRSGSSQYHKKHEAPLELTPLEKMLHSAGPIREDGSDKFFGLENFGNTCYCNSIVQALYHSVQFRENVLKYTPFAPDLANGHTKANVQIRPPPITNGAAVAPTKQKAPSTAEAIKRRQTVMAVGQGAVGGGQKPEDKPDSPEYKKKQALQKGPVLELGSENSNAYGMGECTFTGLKDIFTTMIESDSRTGVLSPGRFLDIFKQNNENFQTSMHQDAHEFYGLVLNDVITTIEENSRKVQELELELAHKDALTNGHAAVPSHADGMMGNVSALGAGWVHDIFEGLITSETKCLACETTSQRDETFLDLSIDLEEHSSVTSCLKNFSAEEMLCERNKFHCDTCGGLQEAEKRMKIKTLPKVLALHLKRFKYTEDYSRLQKLFHRVVYPYYLRMFNTTDDVEDPDRLYELYAVVIHIGGNAYHGHYVSVIKTQDRGWLLFDDEMVEPVDKHFVKNFFGDKPGMACAYLLLYQETTFDKALADQEAEGYLDVDVDEEGRVSVSEIHTNGDGVPAPAKQPANGLNTSPEDNLDALATSTLMHAKTAPGESYTNGYTIEPAVSSVALDTPIKRSDTAAKSRSELKKEAKAAEKAQKAKVKDQRKAEAAKKVEQIQRVRDVRKAEEEDIQRAIQLSMQEANSSNPSNPSADGSGGEEATTDNTPMGGSFLNRANRGSRSMAKKSFAFLGTRAHREKKEDGTDANSADGHTPHHNSHHHHNGADRSVSGGHQFEKLRGRLSFNLGRKKSSPVLG
ncbi:ubiquitin carboxyl-terminal hydrolase [Zalerion maritima]|uniref:Ubiquitin carboxyl-terminal hydrolase n=1 Tax=Zalerion maritima TaxID=339359 RepID=A0AAD5WQC7_9PEZI|nr:ubiquitin carboxyl-terminal hydrolase [Zalerion maritima]